MKLFAAHLQRRHQFPRLLRAEAMHANMFQVRRAGDVMERDVVVMPAAADLDEFLRQHGAEGRCGDASERRTAPR